MIVELSKAAKTLSDGRGDLFGTVDNLAHFAAVLNKYDQQIVAFQQNLGDVSTTLDDTSDDLKKAFDHIQGAAAPEVTRFLASNRPGLHEALDRLGSVTRAVARTRDALAQTLHVAPNALTNFTNLVHPRTGQLYGALSIGYQNSLASPGNQVCALITQAAAANPLTGQHTCAEALGPLFAQLVTMAPQIQTAPIPNIGVPLITVPQGSTPPYGDVDQRDHQPDTDPSPNGSNSDLPRSTTSDHSDQSFSDRFPVPLPTPNPHLGGN
jgi:phospholipid/cholesterol/gamma-HCH transport system substrate-binding protein